MGMFGPKIQSNVNAMSAALGRDPFNVQGGPSNTTDVSQEFNSLQKDYQAKQAADAATARQAAIDNDPAVVAARNSAKEASDNAATQAASAQQAMSDSAVSSVNAANSRANSMATASLQSDTSANSTPTPTASVDTASNSQADSADPRRKFKQPASSAAVSSASASRGGAGISIS